MTPAQVLFNSTDELICTVNSSGDILEVNNSWKHFFGQFKVSLIFDLFDLEFSEEIAKLLKSDSFTQELFPESKIIHPKREVCWMTVKIQALTKGRYLFLLKDVTEEKKLSGILSQVLENYKIGHFSFDSETQKLTWSEKVFELFEKNETHFEPNLKFFTHAFGDKHIEYLNNLFNSPLSRKIDFVLPYTKEDGNLCWLSIKARKVFSTPINYSFQGIIQDVTKDKLKEIFELSRNVEISSFEKGLDSFSIVARTDKHGKIIYANEEFCRISQYTHDELIGKDHRILNSGFHPKSFFKEMWEAIIKGNSWRGEIKNRAKDGTYYWVDTIIIPIRDSEGELREVLSFRYEITHLKELENYNRILKNKLELIVGSQENMLWDFDFLLRKLTLDYKFLEALNVDLLEDMNLDAFFSHFKELDAENLNKFITCKVRSYLELPCVLKMNQKNYRVVLKMRILRNEAAEAIHLDGLCTIVELVAEPSATEVIDH